MVEAEIENIAEQFGFAITTDINEYEGEPIKGVVLSSDIKMDVDFEKFESSKVKNSIIIEVSEEQLSKENVGHIKDAVKINANSAIIVKKAYYINPCKMKISLFSKI